MANIKTDAFIDLPGCYAFADQPQRLYINLGEVLASRNITDCQEARAAMYGTLLTACEVIGLQLVIVQEDGVPSISDLINAHGR